LGSEQNVSFCPELTEKKGLGTAIWATKSLYYRYEKERMSGGDTVSMSNAEDFINDTRKAIKEVRRRAFWFNPAGWAICLVGLAISIAGLIKGLALAPRNGPFAGIFSAMGTSPWNWLYETHGRCGGS
jgi:hypothetical protein